MRTSRMFLVAVTAGWAAIAAGPAIADGASPRPPRQDEAWEPPHSALPAAMIDAARVLFEQGLADPRGCVYREVELADEVGAYRVLNPWPPTIHAWAIPFEATGGPRYVVAWNGLVYRASKLGPAADLEADIDALVTPTGPRAQGFAPRRRAQPLVPDPMRWGLAKSHLDSARQGDLMPIKVVLLLRLGRADLAERVWKAEPYWQSAMDAKDPRWVSDLYANLSAEWEWALLDRAAMAHARRDDPTALATLRELTRIRPMIDARKDALRPPGPVRPENRPLFPEFIAQLPQFLADQERRSRAPKRTPATRRPSPDRAARIAAMIRDFDEIPATQPPYPNYLDTISEDVVKAVIREKGAAVGPLLDALERDDRLTRFVEREGRDGIRYIRVKGVDEVAYRALGAILETRPLSLQARYYTTTTDRAIRRAVAAELRASWEKNPGLNSLESLFLALADDEGTPGQWLAAATALVQPNDGRDRGWAHATPDRPGGKVPPPRGEPLRGRAGPSITALLARRTFEIEPRKDQAGWINGFRTANGMAMLLAQWDLKGSLPTLRDRMSRSIPILRDARGHDNALDGLDLDIAQFTMLRACGGDLTALDDYAAWIRKSPRPDGFSSFEPVRFEPLWRYPEHPAIAAASIAMFEDPASPWVPLFRPGDAGWRERGFLSDIIVSPMLGVAAFRKQVLAGLADDRPQGEVRFGAANKVTIEIDRSVSQNLMFLPDDSRRPRPVTRMPLRMSDHYAWKLQEIGGFPRIELNWLRDLRDRAIAEDVALLKRYGERFRTTEVTQSLHAQSRFYPKYVRGFLAFEPLNRPATAADVSAGRAIFAGPPDVEARAWPLPARPLRALWPTLEIPDDEPFLRAYKGLPEKASMIRSRQWGWIWQAEEVREGGRWRRYFGFVGHHVMARVPAEALEFPADWDASWPVTTPDLDARLIPPGGREVGRYIATEPISPDGPMTIVLRLRNHRGIDRTIPIDLARTVDRPALRDGVTIRLAHQPEPLLRRVAGFPRNAPPPPPPPIGQWRQFGPPKDPWPELAARREPERYRSEAARTLGPTETVEVLRLDLRHFFDLERPGHYLVAVELPGIEDGAGKPARASATFVVKEDPAPAD